MPTGGRATLTQFLIEERKRAPGATGDLNALITDVSLACKAISCKVAYGALGGVLGSAGSDNVQGEDQKRLDVISNDIFLRANEWGRARGGHGLGRAGARLHAAREVPARQVPADVRPARRFVEHRRERGGRQHLLDRAGGHTRRGCERGRLPATRRAAGLRRLRDLRPLDDAGADDRPRHARVHARADARRVGAEPPEPAHPRQDARVRDQRIEQPLLGAGREALCRRVPRRPDRPARRRLQHALDRLARRRDAPHPDARWRVHVPARQQGSGQTRPPAAALRSEPDLVPDRTGRRPARATAGSV